MALNFAATPNFGGFGLLILPCTLANGVLCIKLWNFLTMAWCSGYSGGCKKKGAASEWKGV